MSFRWQVLKNSIKWKGTCYEAGQLMPASFTDRDRERQVYSRRLIKVEIPDEPLKLEPDAVITPPSEVEVVSEQEVTEVIPEVKEEVVIPKEVLQSGVPKASPVNTTGTQAVKRTPTSLKK